MASILDGEHSHTLCGRDETISLLDGLCAFSRVEEQEQECMINNIVASLGHLPAAAVYLFVFVWLAGESCGVPLPNELVLLLAGSLAAQRGHGLSGVVLVIVAVLGSLTGAMGAYTIGMRGGREAVIRL